MLTSRLSTYNLIPTSRIPSNIVTPLTNFLSHKTNTRSLQRYTTAALHSRTSSTTIISDDLIPPDTSMRHRRHIAKLRASNSNLTRIEQASIRPQTTQRGFSIPTHNYPKPSHQPPTILPTKTFFTTTFWLNIYPQQRQIYLH
jgi:hypothetical protein